jgi:hypothetical protein
MSRSRSPDHAPHGNHRNSIADVVLFVAVIVLFFLSIGVGFA